jgi:hypothetical protein
LGRPILLSSFPLFFSPFAARMMRTCLLCIQCKDRSLEHVHDSWISRYVLTLSIVLLELTLGSMHVLLIRNNGENQQGRPHQGGVHVQLDFDSTSDSRTLLHQN